MAAEPYRCGAIALVGRPNVGKSTLLNALLGQKLSITSHKPQTTRQTLRGVLTTETAQFVLIDTPGFQTRHRGALNRAMNRAIRGALDAVDAVALIVEAKRFGPEDRTLLKQVREGVPLFLVVNKIDTAAAADLLPFLKKAAGEAKFDEIVPVSAQSRKGLDELLRALERYLPEQPAVHSEDDLTDSNERFLAAEFLREKLFRFLGAELPYSTGVEIEKFEDERGMRRIHAAIVVGREGHKAIIIGSGGNKLKRIATAARLDMEKLFGGKVYLQVWVKVRSGWTDDEAALRHMGYG